MTAAVVSVCHLVDRARDKEFGAERAVGQEALRRALSPHDILLAAVDDDEDDCSNREEKCAPCHKGDEVGAARELVTYHREVGRRRRFQFRDEVQ